MKRSPSFSAASPSSEREQQARADSPSTRASPAIIPAARRCVLSLGALTRSQLCYAMPDTRSNPGMMTLVRNQSRHRSCCCAQSKEMTSLRDLVKDQEEQIAALKEELAVTRTDFEHLALQLKKVKDEAATVKAKIFISTLERDRDMYKALQEVKREIQEHRSEKSSFQTIQLPPLKQQEYIISPLNRDLEVTGHDIVDAKESEMFCLNEFIGRLEHLKDRNQETIMQLIRENQVFKYELQQATVKMECDQVHDISSELIEDISSEPIEDISSELIEDISSEMIQDVSSEPMQDVSSELVQGMLSETIQDISSELVQYMSSETIQDVSSELVQDISSEKIQDVSSEVMRDISSEAIQDISSEAIQDISCEVIPHISSEPIPMIPSDQVNLSHFPQEMKSTGTLQLLSDQMQEIVSDQTQTRLSESLIMISNQIQHPLSNQMQEISSNELLDISSVHVQKILSNHEQEVLQDRREGMMSESKHEICYNWVQQTDQTQWTETDPNLQRVRLLTTALNMNMPLKYLY